MDGLTGAELYGKTDLLDDSYSAINGLQILLKK